MSKQENTTRVLLLLLGLLGCLGTAYARLSKRAAATPVNTTVFEDFGFQDTAHRVRVGAFNIQVFGITKYSKEHVTTILEKILARYDLILVQEIRDSSDTAFHKLVEDLKSDRGLDWRYVISERLGRSASKEQYAYLYRGDLMSVNESFVYNGSFRDDYQRPPYCAHFHMPNAAVKDMVVIGVHTQPGRAELEVSRLVNVYDEAVRVTGVKDAILMGDFNADCSYVTRREWKSVALRHDPRFHWLIDDVIDTTTKTTDCAYDRMVVAGRDLLDSVVPGTTKPFRFDLKYNLSSRHVKEVSDHYPIETQLYGAVSPRIQQQVAVSHSITVSSRVKLTLHDLRLLASQTTAAGFDVTAIKIGRGIKRVTATIYDVTDVSDALQSFREEYPALMHDTVIATAASYLATGALKTTPRVAGLPAIEKPYYHVVIAYSGASLTYEVTISKTIA